MTRHVGCIQMVPAGFVAVQPEEMIDVQKADSALSPGTGLLACCATFVERYSASDVDLETRNSCGMSFGCIFLD
jgi:hypothetical protein